MCRLASVILLLSVVVISGCGSAVDGSATFGEGQTSDEASGSDGLDFGAGDKPSTAASSDSSPDDRSDAGAGAGQGAHAVAVRRRAQVAQPETLAWLASQQSEDGGWQDGLTSAAGASDDPALTGLVILAFLGKGYTNRGQHDFAGIIAKGLRFLKHRQGEDGRFRPSTRIGELRDHLPAAHAMVEAYGMTGSLLWRGSARSGLNVIALACEEGDPHLRDPECAARALMTILSARMIDQDAAQRGKDAPFEVDLRRLAPLDLRRTSEGITSGRDLAPAILARLVFEGNDTKEARAKLQTLAGPILRKPLSWTTDSSFGGPADWVALNFALEAVRGKEAAAWQKAARCLIRSKQEGRSVTATLRGSWAPGALSGYSAGRIRLTTLCLGVLWYRCYDMLIVEGPV